MLRNAVKMLTRNLGLKLLALLFAVAMWMAVVNLEDPVINKRFTVAVTVENDEVITAMNKYYEIEAESANVTFSVLGSRSVVDTLSSLDFKATADMSQLIQKEDGNVVPVEITALRHSSQLTISKRTRELKVTLADLMRQAFMILPNPQGEPAKGYALGTLSVEPNRLWVSGPKEVVSQIDSVKASIDVSDMSTDISDSVVPVLLDERGEEVDTTRLDLSLEIVTVKANIVPKKAVPVKVNYSGRPAEGFEVISADTDLAEVTIKGRSEILNAISAITIPEDVISVEGVDEKFEQKVDINQYLPSGVSLENSKEATVTVRIDIEQLERRVFTIPVRNIRVDDLPEKYRLEYNERNAEIEIYGLTDDLDQLTTNALRPVLAVSGLAPGRHVRQLQLTLDEKYVVGENVISFTIYSENSEDDSEGDEPDNPAEGGSGAGEGDGGTAADQEGEGEPDAGTQPDESPDTGDREAEADEQTTADSEYTGEREDLGENEDSGQNEGSGQNEDLEE